MSVRRAHNGTYFFVVDDPTAVGRRRQIKRRGFRSRTEAKAAMAALLVEVEDEGRPQPLDSGTVSDYVEAWLAGLPVRGRRPSTISSYDSKLHLYVVPRLGQVRLHELDASHLDSLYADMAGRGLSMRTIRYTHSIVRRALQDGVRQGRLRVNVADRASPPDSASTRPPEADVWTPEQLRHFLDGLRGRRYAALFRLAAMTGLRRGELCGLGWRQVDLDRGQVEVTRNLTVIKGVPTFGPPKSRRGRRSVALDEATCGALRGWKATQSSERLAAGPDWMDDHGSLVFTNRVGKWWRPDWLSRRFPEISAELGLPHIPFHGLRHTHATHLLAAGENPRLVSERLGHSSVAFTLDTYAHVLPTQQASAAEAVARLVDGS